MTTTLPVDVTRTGPMTPREAGEIVDAFERAAIAPADWDHRAHCVVALSYLLQRPAATVVHELRVRIVRFNEAVGIPNTEDSGYHETLTRTYVAGLAAFLARHADAAAGGRMTQRLLDALSRDPVSTRTYVEQLYSAERLWSPAARCSYVAPDRGAAAGQPIR